jgi:hypothetical protein
MLGIRSGSFDPEMEPERQFILKAAPLSSRAAFGCWGCAAEREA